MVKIPVHLQTQLMLISQHHVTIILQSIAKFMYILPFVKFNGINKTTKQTNSIYS